MKLPSMEFQLQGWGEEALAGWERLTRALGSMRQGMGRGDAFQQEVEVLWQLARRGGGLGGRLHRRVTARALTTLWLEDGEYRTQTLRADLLADLVSRQVDGLGVITLQKLIALYFQEFDQLEEVETGLRSALETVLEQQLALRAKTWKARGALCPDSLPPSTIWRIACCGPRAPGGW